MADLYKNFAYSTVATAPSPATSGTSLVVASGEGTRFPTPPFNAVVWPASVQPLSSNAEIVRVTAISTDTLTITRAQESTTAKSVATGWQIIQSVTVKTLADLASLADNNTFTGTNTFENTVTIDSADLDITGALVTLNGSDIEMSGNIDLTGDILIDSGYLTMLSGDITLSAGDVNVEGTVYSTLGTDIGKLEAVTGAINIGAESDDPVNIISNDDTIATFSQWEYGAMVLQQAWGDKTIQLIEAPSGSPEESTTTLQLNYGSGNREFLDVTIEDYAGVDHKASLNIGKQGTGTIVPFVIRTWDVDAGTVASVGKEYFTITPLSEVVINESSQDVNFRVESDGNANAIFVDAGNNRVGILNGSPSATFDVTGTGAFSGDVTVPDEAYHSTNWNGSLEVPTKNAVRDKIEAIGTDFGFVVGPGSATDNAVVRFDSTSGKIVQNSTVTIGDTGGIATTIANSGNAIGLSVTQNDTTNNPVALDITNAGTGSGLRIAQNGVLNGTHNGLRLTSSAAQVNTYLAEINNSSTSTSVRTMLVQTAGSSYALSARSTATGGGGALEVINSSTGHGVLVDQNSNGIGLYVDRDVTNVNSSTSGLVIANSSIVNDAATYTKTAATLSITSDVTETSGTITDSAQVVDINQTHADATGTVVDIDNDGVGTGLYVHQDGTLASTASAFRVDWNSDNTASGSVGGYFYSNFAHTDSTTQRSLFRVLNDNTSSVATAAHITQDGTGNALAIDENGNGIGLYVDKDVTNANSTSRAVQIDHTSAVNDAGTYTKTGSALQIISNVSESSGTITDSAITVDIDQDHADATGNVVDIANTGTGSALAVNQEGVLGSGEYGLRVYSNAALVNGTSRLVSFHMDNASSSRSVLELVNDGTGTGITLDNNGIGRAIEIDHDASSASAITGIHVNVANAGAGAAYAAVFEAGRVGIGTAAPAHQLDVVGTSLFTGDMTINTTAAPALSIINPTASGSGGGAGFVVYSDDGAAMSSGDRLGYFLTGGAHAGSGARSNTAGIIGFASENWSGTNKGTELRFEVTPDTTASRVVALKIGANSHLYFGSSSDAEIYRSAAGVLTTPGNIEVASEAYGGGWSGSNEVPTKGDVYTKVETVIAGGSGISEELAIAYAVAL